ncbi:MAG: hypothetical protein BME94_00715 [Methanobacteriales archaeon Met13]
MWENLEKSVNYPALTPHQAVLDIIREWIDQEQEGDKSAWRRAQERIEPFLVATGDGSYTFHSQKVDGNRENMHSTHGAVEEARKKFAHPARLMGPKKVRVLDICSGLGYNAAAALEKILATHPASNPQIELDLVEISIPTLAAGLLMDPPLPTHSLIRRAVEDHLIKEGILKFHREEELPHNLVINVHCQDARRVKLKGSYQAVFLDPFSPAKSPELYSVEFLSYLAKLLAPEGMILTYTSAAPVRTALLEAGLEVGEGPRVGRKGGTIASPSLEGLKPLTNGDERMIALSDAGVPYRDPLLDDLPLNILKRRREEREKVRNSSRFASTVRTPLYLNETVEDPKLERRINRQIQKMGLDHWKSPWARYLICPQYTDCICHCGGGGYPGSRQRIKEMQRRLALLLNQQT